MSVAQWMCRSVEWERRHVVHEAMWVSPGGHAERPNPVISQYLITMGVLKTLTFCFEAAFAPRAMGPWQPKRAS